MRNRKLVYLFSYLMLAFYIGLIMFTFFFLTQAWHSINCPSAVAFEVVGFLIVGFVLHSVIPGTVKQAYAVSLSMITLAYTAVLDVICLLFVHSMPSVFFILSNLMLLFVYFLISIPMFISLRK